MTQPGAAGDEVPEWFLHELDEAFRRYRPQHSLRWDYDAAFGHLCEVGHPEGPAPSPLLAEDPPAGVPEGGPALDGGGPPDEEPSGTAPDGDVRADADDRDRATGQAGQPAGDPAGPLRGLEVIRRSPLLRRASRWRGLRPATETPTGPEDPAAEAEPGAVPGGRGTAGEDAVGGGSGDPEPGGAGEVEAGVAGEGSLTRQGLGATVEAFRFLAARVGVLEEEVARRRRPIEGLEWLVPPEPATGWYPAAAAAVAVPGTGGPVVHAECGEGSLVELLGERGLEASGVEPRGAVAAEAARRGLRVHPSGSLEYLRRCAPASLGGLVLSGIVDRLAVEDLCELLMVATDRLAPGAPLVVLSGEPDPDRSGWPVTARDLLPGRPRHSLTWRLLLERAGYLQVAALSPPPGSDPPGAAVSGRRSA